MSKVRVQDVQHRPGKRRPWVARWTVDGRPASESHPTKASALAFRSRLETAARNGELFDPATMRPVSWTKPQTGQTVAEWAARWHAREWPTSAPRTRKSRAEALARVVLAAVADPARAPKRPAVIAWLDEAARGVSGEPDWAGPVGVWLRSRSLPLAGLDPVVCDRIEATLAVGDDGGRIDPSRYRKVGRQCLAAAVELGLLAEQPWRAPKRGRRRKTSPRRTVDVRALPAPEDIELALKAVVSHQPASVRYQRMTACLWLGGFRPSEVLALTCEALTLPQSGWGKAIIDVSDQRAGARYLDDDEDDIGDTKTGVRRVVPLHPRLVAVLAEAVADAGGRGPLWVTRTGGRPTASNWSRAWTRAAGPGVRLYDLRHAHATRLIGAGVPLGEIARRLGHSVETLVRTYAGAFEADVTAANELLADAF